MNKRLIKICLFAGFLYLLVNSHTTVLAMPAFRDGFTVTQPDGNVVSVYLKGDEWSNRTETIGGYTIYQNSHDGYWYYLSGYVDEIPQLTGTKAHHEPPGWIEKHIKKESDTAIERQNLRLKKMVSPQRSSTAGSGKILIILADFSNSLKITNESDWATILRDEVIEYYRIASYGNTNLTVANESSGTPNNGVIDWVNLGYNHPSPNPDASSSIFTYRSIAKDAVTQADATIPTLDFSAFDTNTDGIITGDELAILIVAEGYEAAVGSIANSVWGHQSAFTPTVFDGVTLSSYAMFGEIHINHQATVGIVVHELGHLIFDLPDLYDTDDTSSGIGAWGLMGGGSWGYQVLNGEFDGKTPVNPCAWVKYKLGWVTGPTASGVVSVTGSGSSSANSSNSVYRVSTPNPSEYFLVENRQFMGFDRGLSGFIGTNFGGISIWHIDESVSENDNDSIRLVDIEEAGNTQMVGSDDLGSAANLWVNGGAFNIGSSPSSTLNSGNDSGVSILILSESGETMNVNFGFSAKEEEESCFLSTILD